MHVLMRMLVALALGGAVLAGGCASQPSRFYLLTAMPNVETAAPTTSSQPGFTIGVGPVTLPRYLDRPQIVTRTSPYEIKLAEFDRWAEALDANFMRVLVENLSQLLPPARVVMYPWPRATATDYQIIVDVTHFLSQVGGDSLLIADWTLLRGEGPEVLSNGRARFSASPSGADYSAIVAAMSQTVASLSREIATGLKGVGPRVSTRKGVSGRLFAP